MTQLNNVMESIDMYGVAFMSYTGEDCLMNLIDIALTIVEQCCTSKLTVFVFNSDYYKHAVELCLNLCKTAILQNNSLVVKSSIYYTTTLYHTICQRSIMFRNCTLTDQDQEQMYLATDMVYRDLHEYMTNMSVETLVKCEKSVDNMCDLFRTFKETEDGVN